MALELGLHELFTACQYEPSILPPVDVLERFEALYKRYPALTRRQWGEDTSGRPLYSYHVEHGEETIFMYAFPDPGEAVGGTGLLALLRLLLDPESYMASLPYRWVFVPCLNFVDQPDKGRSLRKLMKTASQEVDWCVSAPRPETTAVLDIADTYKPIFTFPLHDEYHHRRYVAPYIGLARPIDEDIAMRVRTLFTDHGVELDREYCSEPMGEGFFLMPEIGEEYLNSTFHHCAHYGQVLVVEIPSQSELPDVILTYLQLVTGLIVCMS